LKVWHGESPGADHLRKNFGMKDGGFQAKHLKGLWTGQASREIIS
jgi:hypothetical protein